MWRALVLLALNGALLAGFISPSEHQAATFFPRSKGNHKKEVQPLPNPEFEVWGVGAKGPASTQLPVVLILVGNPLVGFNHRDCIGSLGYH